MSTSIIIIISSYQIIINTYMIIIMIINLYIIIKQSESAQSLIDKVCTHTKTPPPRHHERGGA